MVGKLKTYIKAVNVYIFIDGIKKGTTCLIKRQPRKYLLNRKEGLLKNPPNPIY